MPTLSPLAKTFLHLGTDKRGGDVCLWLAGRLYYKKAGIVFARIGVVIAVFQQWCGIDVIFTFVGMYAVDRLGRRALLLFGAAGLACIYAILGTCYYFQVTGVAVLCLVVAAIACYAMTLATIVWMVISEIFPTRIRGMAMAVATFSLEIEKELRVEN